MSTDGNPRRRPLPGPRRQVSRGFPGRLRPRLSPRTASPPGSCFPALSSGPFLKFASQLPLGPSATPVPSELCGVRATPRTASPGMDSAARAQGTSCAFPPRQGGSPGGPGPLSHSTSRLGPPGAYYGLVTLESGCHLWSNQSVVIRSSFQGRPVHRQCLVGPMSLSRSEVGRRVCSSSELPSTELPSTAGVAEPDRTVCKSPLW